MAPEGDTCFTGEGKSSRIDFSVVNRLAKDMMIQVDTVLAAAHHIPSRTHKVVTITIMMKGHMWLEKLIRREAIPAHQVTGPCRGYTDVEPDAKSNYPSIAP